MSILHTTTIDLVDWARQLSVLIVLILAAILLHRGVIVLGREYRNCEDRFKEAEEQRDEWQAFALAQLGVSERAVSTAERIVPPGGP